MPREKQRSYELLTWKETEGHVEEDGLPKPALLEMALLEHHLNTSFREAWGKMMSMLLMMLICRGGIQINVSYTNFDRN